MKNTRSVNKTVKTKNFKTQKEAKDYGYQLARQSKQYDRYGAWEL